MSSSLARQVPLAQAAAPSSHSPFCALIYATQNGWKLPLFFEEQGIAYDWALVDFEKREQKSAAFMKVNPNGRIPALMDRERGVTVAESGAILEYLAERTHSPLLPSAEQDLQAHLDVKQWLYFQVSGLGPAMGQAMYFQRIAAVTGHHDPFAIGRFVAEAERCLQVVNDEIEKRGGPFLLGAEPTLADIACFPYCASAFWAKVDISKMQALQSWLEFLHARPSFQRGLSIPFERRAFFGPPFATDEEVNTEIARNAGQFEVVTRDPVKQ